ncbi:MAG: DNA gyrase inhibitor YacG [Gammaproteobacteria bacterium]|nr:DNA gyrase inhibitor YacG [Gammaproteobacteria bacterium]
MHEDPSSPPVVKCPRCGSPVPWAAVSEWKPFCSERCRLIDLGDWLLEKHAIPGKERPADQEESEP